MGVKGPGARDGNPAGGLPGSGEEAATWRGARARGSGKRRPGPVGVAGLGSWGPG